MATTYKEVGAYLESEARKKKPIFYIDLVHHFTDLPSNLHPFPNHPLSAMFEELDQEDRRNESPFRTALVISKEHRIPGDGFFKMMERLRGKAVSKSDRLAVWLEEFKKLTDNDAER